MSAEAFVGLAKASYKWRRSRIVSGRLAWAKGATVVPRAALLLEAES